MPAPDFADINNFLIHESGRIQMGMNAQSRARGFKWNELIPKGTFPLGMGQTINIPLRERSGPNTDTGWVQIELNNDPSVAASGNNAIVPTSQINPASTNYSYSLYYRALNSNPLSVHDANLSLGFADQLQGVVDNLEGNVLDIQEDRRQDEYDRICGHKIVAETDGQPESGYDTAWLQTVPTSRLTYEHLVACYHRLMRDGGAAGLDTVDGNATPLLIVEPEGWNDVLYGNPEVRDDYRKSSESDILLNPLGIKGAYQNFKVVLNYRAPHYDFDGAWQRRSFYSESEATIGTKQDPATTYRDAEIATAYIFHPGVCEIQGYDPDSSYGNGAKFDQDSWMGRFKWVNNKDNADNVDGHTGYFRSLLASATKPLKPNLGYAIRYCRNPASYGDLGCSIQY